MRGLVSAFGRLADIIIQEKCPWASNMACPFTPSPHGLCFSPSWVWSYTESKSQVPTISSLSDFCWPSASLGGRAIPRHRNAKVVIVSVVRRFIVFIVFWSILSGGLGWLSHDDLLREFSESQGAQGTPLVKGL